MTFRFRGALLIVLAAGFLAAAPTAQAAPISLSCETGCSLDPFGAALWSTDFIHPSGTGVFKPFLRLHALDGETTEQGHSTDAPSQDFLGSEIGGIWTHAIEVSSLLPITIGGTEYFVFALDTGEPKAAKKSPLSLDQLKLCTSDSSTLVKAGDCPTTPYYYDLDAGTDREVLLDYRLAGSGQGRSDLVVFIPAFTSPDRFLYLYSMLGGKGGAYQVDGTFSEWRALTGAGTVPEPMTLLLFGPGIAAAAARYRRSRRAS